jgi:predicted transcriptional regulator
MKEPLTPDEDAVFLEFTRRDVKPGEEAKVIDQIAESCNMSYQRTRKAAQGLFKKGYLYAENEKEHEDVRTREILRDLLLHDREIKELLKKVLVEERK